MRATVMCGVGDVRVEDVPDARLIESTGARVRVTRAAICGWPRAMSAVQVAKRVFES